jgi:hypothetical protein
MRSISSNDIASVRLSVTALTLAIGVLFVATACGGEDRSASELPATRSEDEVLTDIGALSDQVRAAITWPGAEVVARNGPPWVQPCAEEEYRASSFTVEHHWEITTVPDSEMDMVREQVEEDLTGLGWEVTSFERVNSKARQFELLAQTVGAEFGLHISFYDRRDPGRTKEIDSHIIARVQSSCYESAGKANSAQESGNHSSADEAALEAEAAPFTATSLDPRFGSTRKAPGGRDL